MNKQLLMKTPI